MYDMIAIGNALVDTQFMVTDAVLESTKLTKSNMTLADTDTQTTLFTTLIKHGISPSKKSGGGSAANSAVAFGALGGSAFYNCRVGDDEMGQFYLDDLKTAGVATNPSQAVVNGTTGSCVVLVSPDGERTMQTNLAVSSEIGMDNIDIDAIKHGKYLYLEGYLAMSPTAMPAIKQLCLAAKNNDTKIVVSFADPAVVKFAKAGLLEWLKDGVDMIFCNMDEACLFTDSDPDTAVSRLLDFTQMAVVTNGGNPTHIGMHTPNSQKILKIAVPSANVIDTNGAGDNFAGAFLYALNQGLSLEQCVKLAGSVAARVVEQVGARLDINDYQAIKTQVIA